MKKRIQFPLFELMLILILLFVLAIFALPKFVDVGVEARISSLNTMAKNLNAINGLLYNRAMINGVQNNALQSTDVLGGNDVGAYLVFGELRAQETDLKRYLDSEYVVYDKGDSDGGIRLYLDSYKDSGCFLYYHQAILKEAGTAQAVIQKATYKVRSVGC